jgi:hypothetical protein
VPASIANTALVIHSTDDGKIVSKNSVGCTYTYAVEGVTASLVPGQTCDSVPDGRGGHVTEALEMDTLTLRDNGSIAVSASGALGGACEVTVTGTVRRP